MCSLFRQVHLFRNERIIDENTEAIMVARYMKQATINDTVSNALRMLSTDQ